MTNICYSATPWFGQTQSGVFVSDLPKLKTSFNSNMTLRQINLCGLSGKLEGI